VIVAARFALTVFFYRDAMVRVATVDDAAVIGRLLHDFNTEFDEPTPSAAQLAERLRELLPTGETVALLAGDGPDGFAVLRFRPSLYTPAVDCYLAELYVVPDRRGNGLGRAMMDFAIDLARERGADHMELTTAHDDVAARSLYASLGFTNREGRPDGPVMYYYERDL
jgi:ribosomal protein S18 acetylase RimI-like enzyme